jgi:hypothetical protein
VSPWKVILATMVIFACGVITGAMVSRTVGMRSQERPLAAATNAASRMAAGPVLQMQRAAFFKRMDKELDLSPGQRDAIGKILKASQERTQPLWDQIAPQMRDELKQVRVEIRGVLSPDQWKEFGEMMRGNRKPGAAPPTNALPSRSSQSTAPATNGG